MMARRKHHATWDEIAFLDADHMARWGAFNNFVGAVHFDADVAPAHIAMAHRDNAFVLSYDRLGHDGDPHEVRARIELDRRPCPFGGARTYFICPRCARRTLRLAVLPTGLMCGACGRITWGSRRETAAQRLVRRANKLADRLGLESILEAPTRPARMRKDHYLRISAELAQARAEIEALCAKAGVRADGRLGAMAIIARFGL